jgi:MYXO-CTERM domain-containing protein
MRPACTVLLLFTACSPVEPMSDSETPMLLDDDFVMDPASLDPIGRFEQGVTTGDGPGGAHVLFLNFDGATITRGSDNPGLNRSFIPNSASTVIPPFDDSRVAMFYTRAAAINEVVKYSNGFYANYNVHIVTTRPASGRYSMFMVGGTATLVGSGGSVVGIAPLDCGNANESNVGFAFSASLIPSNRTSLNSANNALRQLAITIVHEAGHAYGLEHTSNTADIMYPSVAQGQASFANTAASFAQPPSRCSNGTTQNTGALLATNIGVRSGPLPDLGGGPADLGTKPPDMTSGGPKDMGAPKDSGSAKDGGGIGVADLADGTDPTDPGEEPTLDGSAGGGRGGGGMGGGCAVAASQAPSTLPLPALLLLGLVFALLRRGYMK